MELLDSPCAVLVLVARIRRRGSDQPGILSRGHSVRWRLACPNALFDIWTCDLWLHIHVGAYRRGGRAWTCIVSAGEHRAERALRRAWANTFVV